MIVAVCGVLFFAALVKSTVGFGDALIAMPIITLMMGTTTATPLVACCTWFITLLIALDGWRLIAWRSAWRLVLAGFFGVPIGVWLLVHAPRHWVIGALGLFLVGYGLYSLMGPTLPVVGSRWAWPLGFTAGALSGAFGTGGPPVVLYAALRRWPPPRFRASIQGVFLPVGAFSLVAHGVAGLFTEEVLRTGLFALPGMILAHGLGLRLSRRFSVERFRGLVHVLLVALGVLLLGRSVADYSSSRVSKYEAPQSEPLSESTETR